MENDNIINTIDCEIMALNEEKEELLIKKENPVELNNKIKELAVERAIFNNHPELVQKIKTAKLKHIKFVSLSL